MIVAVLFHLLANIVRIEFRRLRASTLTVLENETIAKSAILDHQDSDPDEKHSRRDVFDGMPRKIPHHERLRNPTLVDRTVKEDTHNSAQNEGGSK